MPPFGPHSGPRSRVRAKPQRSSESLKINARQGQPRHDSLEPSRLVLIVVGAHLRAELADRPAAYLLQQRAAEWLNTRCGPETEDDPHPLHVLVCSDLWYLNNDSLRRRPTISIGGPTVNALSAYLADKVPSAYAVEGKLLVQFDLEMHELVACCWGIDAERTAGAVEAFSERYLDDFMEAAMNPQH